MKKADIDIQIGQSNKTIKVDSSNGLMVQTLELPTKPSEIIISANGTGTALATVSWTYHVGQLQENAFDIFLRKSSSKEEVKLEICVR